MRHHRKRSGFTLIELTVVITIILVLTALAVLFLPGIMERQRASSGAAQLQSWLMVARARAVRDQAPRGVRLNVTNGGLVTAVQYIEAPPDFSGGTLLSIANVGNLPTVTFAGIDLTAGGQVAAGDYLEINGGGQTYQITAVANATTLSLAASPQLDDVINNSFTPTTRYRIIRQARVLSGEDSLQLPDSVAVDLSLSRAGNTNTALTTVIDPTTNSIDILFDRNGTVIGTGAGFDKFILWVKDVTLDTTEGDQTLVTVYTRTGNIEAHPVNTDGPDPYSFVKEGRASGE
jgi:prepilin-type N-terminal cleavage/methylation domain-containing protein